MIGHDLIPTRKQPMPGEGEVITPQIDKLYIYSKNRPSPTFLHSSKHGAAPEQVGMRWVYRTPRCALPASKALPGMCVPHSSGAFPVPFRLSRGRGNSQSPALPLLSPFIATPLIAMPCTDPEGEGDVRGRPWSLPCSARC